MMFFFLELFVVSAPLVTPAGAPVNRDVAAEDLPVAPAIKLFAASTRLLLVFLLRVLRVWQP